ncbi:o-succinylbenzoate synthase [Nodosilinea sp. PGN35]|uniref:o-succinylbenzoate synthase n=1 Tax=Nodosilinea sp. PGN35 TaxID=3020489 RepID=UPI0023B30017|nr:o-succinylbenzoate synthase [Nodosilinea sp. TSF1-S3]MDF0366848.1 o-succinylbenzoate synthase [Nodosilinea sp. TSF1-S3]
MRPYKRRFVQPLQTAHGPWVWREGLLLRLRDSLGRVGYGEVAPIPWFGSESLAEALAFCQAQGGEWRFPSGSLRESHPIPNELPATQFGLESAMVDLTSEHSTDGQEPAISAICGLLPAGESVLKVAFQRLAQGHCTLKWKIGVHPIANEISWLEQLMKAIPPEARLRLDANGGLSLAEAEQWLAVCDRINDNPQIATVEYLEQPLSVERVGEMREMGQRYQTAIALDESVATVAQLEACWGLGWRGVVVVKPAIAGSPHKLEAFCQQHRPQLVDCQAKDDGSVGYTGQGFRFKVSRRPYTLHPAPRTAGPCQNQLGQGLVFSSVFETVVGRRAALALAARCSPTPAPALGFGTQGCFADDWDTLTPAELWDSL